METVHLAWNYTGWLNVAALLAVAWFFFARHRKTDPHQGHGS
jgi:hypothetical protein